jgi:hypothetical protein
MRLCRTNIGWTGSRLVVLVIMLALIGGRALSAAAQDAEIETYASEQYDFSLEWNTDLWSSYSTSSFDDQESIWLSTGTVTVQLDLAAADGTVRDCVADAVTAAQGTPEFLEPAATDDLTMPAALKGSKATTLTYGMLLEGRTNPVSYGRYLACVSVSPDGMLLIQVEIRTGIWDEELEVVDDLFDQLDLTAA